MNQLNSAAVKGVGVNDDNLASTDSGSHLDSPSVGVVAYGVGYSMAAGEAAKRHAIGRYVVVPCRQRPKSYEVEDPMTTGRSQRPPTNTRLVPGG